MQTANSNSFKMRREKKIKVDTRLPINPKEMLSQLDEENSPFFSLSFKGASKMITFTHLSLLQQYQSQNSKDNKWYNNQYALDEHSNLSISDENMEEEISTRNFWVTQNQETLNNFQQPYLYKSKHRQLDMSRNYYLKKSSSDQESQSFPTDFKSNASIFKPEARRISSSQIQKKKAKKEDLTYKWVGETYKNLDDQKNNHNQSIVDIFFLLAVGILLAQVIVFI